MASTEMKPMQLASTHTTNLGSPLPKRSRLSLRRSSQKRNHNEEAAVEKCPDVGKIDALPTDNVNMIDLTEDATPVNQRPAILINHLSTEDVKVGALGLPNCGNTCFMNSILQVLRHTPGFLNSLHLLILAHQKFPVVSNSEEETEEIEGELRESEREIEFFKDLHSLYVAMKRREDDMRVNSDKEYSVLLKKPVNLVIKRLREVSELFEEGEQHDAHELLITTLEAFATACQNIKKRVPSRIGNENHSSTNTLDMNIVEDPAVPKKQDLQSPGSNKLGKNSASSESLASSLSVGFEGKTRHIIQCMECDNQVGRSEKFMNLEGNIVERIVEYDEDSESCEKDCDGADLMKCLSEATWLSGDNKYFCEACLHLNEAKIISEVMYPPPILALHFSCFKRRNALSMMVKHNIKIIIPQTFQTSKHPQVFCTSLKETYKLFAVVFHIGQSTKNGHYVALIKDAYQDVVVRNPKPSKDRYRPSQLKNNVKQCCLSAEISNIKTISTTTKWLLFDDDTVVPVCIEDDDSNAFPYYNYLRVTAFPCLIFYHKT